MHASRSNGDGGDEIVTESSHEPRSLVDAEAWLLVPFPEDPFAEWATASVECSPIAGFYPEDEVLEIDTTRCNFVTLRQPLPVALPSKALLEIEIIHFDLTASAMGEARLAVGVGEITGAEPSMVGSLPWERSIAIPGPADRIVERFAIQDAAEAGASVVFHLQNHGQNTWRLMRLDWLAPN